MNTIYPVLKTISFHYSPIIQLGASVLAGLNFSHVVTIPDQKTDDELSRWDFFKILTGSALFLYSLHNRALGTFTGFFLGNAFTDEPISLKFLEGFTEKMFRFFT